MMVFSYLAVPAKTERPPASLLAILSEIVQLLIVKVLVPSFVIAPPHVDELPSMVQFSKRVVPLFRTAGAASAVLLEIQQRRSVAFTPEPINTPVPPVQSPLFAPP